MQPITVDFYCYRIRMAKTAADRAVKQIVKRNVEQLMERPEFGGVNVTKLGRFAGIATGGAQRVLDEHTDVQIGLVARVAKAFNVQPWQMLAPDLGSRILSDEAAEAARIVDALPDEDQRRRAVAIIVQMIELNSPKPAVVETPIRQPAQHR